MFGLFGSDTESTEKELSSEVEDRDRLDKILESAHYPSEFPSVGQLIRVAIIDGAKMVSVIEARVLNRRFNLESGEGPKPPESFYVEISMLEDDQDNILLEFNSGNSLWSWYSVADRYWFPAKVALLG